MAEDSYHGRTAGFLVEQPDGIGYLILDSEIFGYPPYKFFEQSLVDGFDTIAEMEPRLGLPAGSLVATVDEYNRHARRGEDPEFHKYRDWLKPLDKPPYAAFDLSVGRAKFAGFSLGGLRTSVDSEVQDARRSPHSRALCCRGLRLEHRAGHAQLFERHLPGRVDLFRATRGSARRAEPDRRAAERRPARSGRSLSGRDKSSAIPANTAMPK